MNKINIDSRIVFIIPSLHIGGMERVMSEILDEFSKDETLELHLILYGITREVFYKIPQNVIIHLPNFKFNNQFRALSTLKTLYFLRKTIIKIKPKTILSFGELWNNFVLLATYGLKTSVFVSDRCQPYKSLGYLHDWLREKLYPRAKGVIAQTSQAKAFYNASIPKQENVIVIGNPINKQELISNPREKIILTVGRLIESKHHNELIKLFVKINNKRWKLIIVGGDALKQNNREKLDSLITSLNAKDSVIMAGNQKDVASYYKRSSIFAFTSSSEGFPNVIGEALSFGLPVVSFNCVAGPADMIEEGRNGNLITLFDYEDFAVKLRRLMDDDDLREKMSAYAPTSVEKFDKNVIGEEYYKFITAV